MPPRKCTKELERTTRANRCIILPVELDAYKALVLDTRAYRAWVDEMIATYPALFPHTIQAGYNLHDMRTSKKLPGIRLRRIALKSQTAEGKQPTYTLFPSGVLPYLVGYTEDVEKPLFLRRFGVPYWALSYVFGRDDGYWYRLECHLGGYNLVKTTVKDSANLPQHLIADEKITWLNGEEVEVAITAGSECILGAALALRPDIEQLTAAYSVFQQEALQVNPTYQPKTVNTDGWKATRAAWSLLFPLTVLIQCFLHAFIKIRDYCRLAGELRNTVSTQVWQIYRAPDPATFRQRTAAFLAWATEHTTGLLQQTILKFDQKVDRFLPAYDYPLAHRTSTMLDRQIDALSRCLYSARFFHGHASSAERIVRAWALSHNFRCYCPRAKAAKDFRSPFHRLNGFVYHTNWLHNLLISSSLSDFHS